MPEIVQILQRQKISAREYALTKMVAIGAEMSDEALKGEVLQREENSEIAKFMTMSQAVQFWRGWILPSRLKRRNGRRSARRWPRMEATIEIAGESGTWVADAKRIL